MMSNLEPDEISDADLDRVAGGTTVIASNNPAVLAKKPTFTSILMDNGTGLQSWARLPPAGRSHQQQAWAVLNPPDSSGDIGQ